LSSSPASEPVVRRDSSPTLKSESRGRAVRRALELEFASRVSRNRLSLIASCFKTRRETEAIAEVWEGMCFNKAFRASWCGRSHSGRPRSLRGNTR
jgi:hypothetical protein